MWGCLCLLRGCLFLLYCRQVCGQAGEQQHKPGSPEELPWSRSVLGVLWALAVPPCSLCLLRAIGGHR